MKTAVLATLASLVLSIGSTYAQNERVYVVMDDDKPKKSRFSSVKEVNHLNVIHHDPIRMMAGEIGFSYERVVKEKLSIEIGVGPTLSGLGFTRFFDFTETTSTNSRFGFLGEIGLRYYPLNDMSALNKLYVMPSIKFRQFNVEYNANGIDLPNTTGYQNDLSYNFNIGFQQWLSDGFSFDYYIGFGLGMRYTQSFYASEDYNPDTQMFEPRWIGTYDQLPRLNFNLGLKVGLGW